MCVLRVFYVDSLKATLLYIQVFVLFSPTGGFFSKIASVCSFTVLKELREGERESLSRSILEANCPFESQTVTFA